MAETTEESGHMTLENLVVNHAYEMLGLITVLEKKGILTRAEIIEEIGKLKG
jgi:hypothetical protein